MRKISPDDAITAPAKNDLLGSLLQGVAIVAAVVVLAMGLRLGLTVAVMAPAVALGGLALYASAGAISRVVTPQANVVVRKLEQGPPVNAPVELRIAGTDRQAVRARVHGIRAGEITYRDTRIEVLVRSPAGEGSSPAGFDDLRIASPVVGSLIPLAAVASVEPEFRPVEITRRNGIRTASVLAELAPGAAYNEVLNQLDQRLAPTAPGIERVIGGAAEESAAANRAIANASYLGAVVLLTILLLQFRSFRKVGIVMTTVPLAAVGVIPGLVIFDQPFGFTSLLGVIALIGIVVNNAIILIDLMDTKRNNGTALEDAITEAVAERMRPIVLTILVVPALYRLMFTRPSTSRSAPRGGLPRALVLALIMAGGLFVPPTRASAETPLSLGEIAERAAANAIEERPIWQGKTTAVLSQPLVNPAAQIGVPAQRRAALRVAGADAAEARDEQALTALLRALEIVDIAGAEAVAVESRDALRAQHERLTRLATGGRALQSDADRIEIALLRVERDVRALRLGREVAEADLARLVESAVRVEVAPLPEAALVVASAGGTG